MAQGEGEVLVEKVSGKKKLEIKTSKVKQTFWLPGLPEKLAHAVVAPPAVDEEEPLQESKLRDAVVGRQDGLHALLARDSHTNMGGCN